MKVKLTDIADELEMIFDDGITFLNKETGEFLFLSREIDRDFDERIEEVEESEDYVCLPGRFEINDFEIMKGFAYSRTESQKNQLLDVLYGPKSYRRFKDKIYHLGIEQDYFDFRSEKLLDIAKNWCEVHHVDYEE